MNLYIWCYGRFFSGLFLYFPSCLSSMYLKRECRRRKLFRFFFIFGVFGGIIKMVYTDDQCLPARPLWWALWRDCVRCKCITRFCNPRKYSLFNWPRRGHAFVRALLPVSCHALIGVIMGFYLGKARFSADKARVKWLTLSLVVPSLLHGSYDFILTALSNWIYYMLPFMVFLWWFGLRKAKKARSVNMMQV